MVEYLGVGAAFWSLRWLPAWTWRWFARTVIGLCAYRVLSRHRRRGYENLTLVLSDDLSTAEREATVRQVFSNLALSAFEFFLADPKDIEFVLTEQSRSVWRTLSGREGGIIFVSAHMGNWEFLPAALDRYQLPVRTVGRPLNNPYLDRWVRDRRKAVGHIMRDRHNSFPGLVKELRRGINIAFLVDQHTRHHPVSLPWFGVPAATTSAPALLSIRTGAPIVPMCLVRSERASRYWFQLAKPIRPRRGASGRREVLRITQEYSEILEMWIRQAPEQWLWLHRRWRDLDQPRQAPLMKPYENRGRSIDTTQPSAESCP